MRNLSKSVLAIAIGLASSNSFADIISGPGPGNVTSPIVISDLQTKQTYKDHAIIVMPSGVSQTNIYQNSTQNLIEKSLSVSDEFQNSKQKVAGTSEGAIFKGTSSQDLYSSGQSLGSKFTDHASQAIDKGISSEDNFYDNSTQVMSSGGGSSTGATFYNNAKLQAYDNAQVKGATFHNNAELQAYNNAEIRDATFQDNSTGLVASGALMSGVTTLNDSSKLIVTAMPADLSTNIDNLIINGNSALLLNPDSTQPNNGNGQVTIGNITLNSGSINFGHEAGSSFTTLNTNVLAGTGGTLRMNGNLIGNNDALHADLISGNGTYTIQLNNVDSGKELNPEGHTLISGTIDPNSNPTFKFAKGQVDQGAHKAEAKIIKKPDGKISAVIVPNLSKTSNSADAVMGLASASQYVFDGEMQALRTRHGDVQQGNGGVWARYLHNSTDITAGAGAAFSLGQNGMEVGADKVFALADGKLSIGALTSYSKSSVNQRDENSHVRSMGAGLYSTYVSSAGYYVDGVVKFNHFNNDLRTRTDQGQAVKGSYSQNGIGASLEAGYKYALGYGLNLDPYVRTTYFAAKGKDITLSNGLKADIGTQQSAKGELGVSVGKTFQLDHVALSPYVTVAVEHEFLKDNKVTFNDRYTYKNDQSGTLGKYGAGLTAQLAKNTQAYAEVDYRKGDKVESPIMANIGVRVNF